MPRTIWVKAHPDQGDRTAMWDRTAGPKGEEVFVAGQDAEPVEVNAEHVAVIDALTPPSPTAHPRLIVLDGETLETARAQAKAAAERRAAARVQSRAEAEAANAPDDAKMRAATQRAEKAEKAAEDAQRRMDEMSAKLDALLARQEAAERAQKAAADERAAKQATKDAEKAANAAETGEKAEKAADKKDASPQPETEKQTK